MSIVERALDRVRRAGGTPHSERHGERAPDPGVEAQPFPAVATTAPHPKVSSINIDYAALQRAGLLPPEARRRQTTDEFRRLKWPIVRAAFATNAPANSNLLLITSSTSGEGKSFVSVNLAFTLAQERNFGVVLVDGDLAKPHLSEVFGTRARKGLTDLLAGRETDPASVLLATDVNSFFLIPAGTPDPAGPELLASQRMVQLLEWIRQNFRDCIVVFDSPPLLATNEAQVLASLVGEVLMVVRADHTPQSVVRDALELIPEGKSVRCVLNQVEWASLGPKYGAYYGDGYGSVPETDNEKRG